MVQARLHALTCLLNVEIVHMDTGPNTSGSANR